MPRNGFETGLFLWSIRKKRTTLFHWGMKTVSVVASFFPIQSFFSYTSSLVLKLSFLVPVLLSILSILSSGGLNIPFFPMFPFTLLWNALLSCQLFLILSHSVSGVCLSICCVTLTGSICLTRDRKSSLMTRDDRVSWEGKKRRRRSVKHPWEESLDWTLVLSCPSVFSLSSLLFLHVSWSEAKVALSLPSLLSFPFPLFVVGKVIGLDWRSDRKWILYFPSSNPDSRWH